MMIVTADTSVYSWGKNEYGQLGHGNREYRHHPTLVAGLKGRNILKCICMASCVCHLLCSWYRVECGGEFSIFKNENGIIMSCGRGDKGVLGHENYQ